MCRWCRFIGVVKVVGVVIVVFVIGVVLSLRDLALVLLCNRLFRVLLFVLKKCVFGYTLSKQTSQFYH